MVFRSIVVMLCAVLSVAIAIPTAAEEAPDTCRRPNDASPIAAVDDTGGIQGRRADQHDRCTETRIQRRR